LSEGNNIAITKSKKKNDLFTKICICAGGNGAFVINPVTEVNTYFNDQFDQNFLINELV